MSLPGQRLRAVTAWLFSVEEREQVLDPIVADLQHELAIVRPDQRWRRMAILGVYVGFWHALAVYSSARGLRGVTALAAGDATWPASIACGGGAALLLLGGIAWTTLSEIGLHQGRALTLFGYLLPQAVPVAAPAGLAIGLITGSQRLTGRGGRRLAYSAALVCCMVGAVCLDRLVPAANQAARVLVYGRSVNRGANELRFSEMRQQMDPRRARISDYFESSDGTYPSLTFWFHARVALSASPFLLALLVVVTAGRLRSISLRVVASAAMCGFVGCYVVIPPSAVASAIERGLLPWLAAWTPNLALLAITGLISARQVSAS